MASDGRLNFDNQFEIVRVVQYLQHEVHRDGPVLILLRIHQAFLIVILNGQVRAASNCLAKLPHY